MNRLTLAGVVVLISCQTGEQRPQEAPSKVAAPTRQRAVQPRTAPITPMVMIATDPPPSTPAQAGQASSPFSLTASDGSGLVLTRLDAKAVVEGPLGFTELHLYFKNPESRVREGTFAITLPSGAAVSRFAMENNGQWQEAEVVEKAVARRVYDDFLHRKQDPALLEKAAGNQFQAKVFPIAANSDKHLVLSFSQELAGKAYTLPLRGLPQTERVDVSFSAIGLDGSEVKQSLNKTQWVPDVDFQAAVPATPAAVSSDTLFVGALAVPPRPDIQVAPPRALTLLVDTSASRALGYSRYVRSIRELVGALRARAGDPMQLQVVAFDQDTQVIFDGLAADYGDAQDKLLFARGAAGASNLAQAVGALTAPHRRVVVVTDAVITAGPETPSLVAAVKRLAVDRVDVVLAGGIRDERLAASVVRAGLPQAGDVYDLDRGAQTVAAGLGEPVVTDMTIDVPGAVWVYPRTVPAARPGSPLMVYAKLPRIVQQLDVVLGGTWLKIGAASGTPALVERAIAAAEIEELENKLATQTDALQTKKLREDITKRSVAARVVSSQTSMLVLESESDYERYNIPRTSLADILVIGPNGLEQSKRTNAFLAAEEASKKKRKAQELAERDDPPPPEEEDDGDDESGGTGTAMALEEGRMGRRDSDRAEGRYSMRRSSDDPQLSREQAIDAARSAGVLGNASLDGSGALVGNEAGEMNGGFGFGRSGFGPGGGGTGWGTIGHGSGTGSGYGVGGGRGGMRGRTAAVPTVSMGTATVTGDLDRNIIRRYIRRSTNRLQYCYERELLASPRIQGTVTVQFLISPNGSVTSATATGVHASVADCVATAIKAIEFPHPAGGGAVQVRYPLTFSPTGGSTHVGRGHIGDDVPTRSDDEESRGGPALEGKLADVMKLVKSGAADKALTMAQAWHDEAPGDVLALIALGEAFEAKQNTAQAARIYGSIIDLFSSRADMRRFAGERLERLGAPQRSLVIDTYRRAVADRPDHATGHRLLAYALVRAGDYPAAFAAILAGLDQKYPGGRFAGADRIMREDAGMIAAAYLANGGDAKRIGEELAKRDAELIAKSSTRFIMYWETDSNDVDFHIRDSRGGHAWYSSMELPSGGELYADVTTGYGPECFAIQGKPTAGPYRLSINYFSQGPMGYGMGLLQIQRFDGKAFTFEDRPYVIMRDHAFVDLGTYR